MSNLLDAHLKMEETFLSVDASVLYDERTNSYVCIKLEDLDSEQTLRLNGDSEQTVYDRLKKEGLIVSYTPEQQHAIKEDMKWLLQEHYQEELAEQIRIGWDDLTNAYLYESDGRLAVEVPGVGLGIEQVAGGTDHQWRLINRMSADPADRYYGINSTKELTYTPKHSQEFNRVTEARDTPESGRGEPDDGIDELLAELDDVPNELLEEAFRSIKEFDISEQDVARLEEVYEPDLDEYGIKAVARGDRLEDGRYRLETSHRIENQTRGVSSGESFVIEFRLSNESFEFEVIDNRKETYHNQIPLKPVSHIRDRQKYHLSVSDLNESQQERIYNLCVFPINEVDNALFMLDEHELILEQNKTHDMNQWLTNYNGLTQQEQEFVVKKIDYNNHLTIGESVTNFPETAELVEAIGELDQTLFGLVEELEALQKRSEGLYALESELSMMPETIAKSVHELLATENFKRQEVKFNEINSSIVKDFSNELSPGDMSDLYAGELDKLMQDDHPVQSTFLQLTVLIPDIKEDITNLESDLIDLESTEYDTSEQVAKIRKLNRSLGNQEQLLDKVKGLVSDQYVEKVESFMTRFKESDYSIREKGIAQLIKEVNPDINPEAREILNDLISHVGDPIKTFTSQYGLENDLAFSTEEISSLYKQSEGWSSNEVYAAINLHQSETILEWSYSGLLSKAEIDDYLEHKTERLSGKVTSGHSTYQINTDTELLIVPNTEGRGHDGFLLSSSGDVTSLKTSSTDETIDQLVVLDAYAVPSLPSMKKLLASPDPFVSQENTKHNNLSKTIGSADLGRDYR